jgi:serine/threonine protein kinase
VYQLLESLAFIHLHKICHRDIKPENILYDKEEHSVKLIDFGISRKLIDRGRKKEMLTLTGTPYYRAPEMFEGGGYDEKVDIWALGVTMYKLMAGVTPFESEYHSETIANIIRGEIAFPEEVESRFSKSCRNLVLRLLKKRADRLTAEEALRDMWFLDVQKRQKEEEFELTLSANNMLSNFSTDWLNNNSLVATNNSNMHPRKKDQGKEKPALLKEGKSFRDMLAIDEEESMIYGCE